MSRIGVLVLAAGRSSRFGTAGAHKLLAMVDGVPLVRLAVRAAVEADVGDVVVVTGAQAEAIEKALGGLSIRIVHEPAFANGMALSLRRGVATLERDSDAVIIALGDQPDMRPEAYREVASRWRTSRSSIVVPRYSGWNAPAHPTLFAADVFPELLALEGDFGARAIIARSPARVAEAPLDWQPPRDVDTTEDLEALRDSRVLVSGLPTTHTGSAGPLSHRKPIQS